VLDAHHPWRSVLASALDQPPGGSRRLGQRRDDNASAVLLALWLGRCLKVPVTQTVSAGPASPRCGSGPGGDITVSRSDGVTAVLSRPGAPASRVALQRRDLADLLSEELRRLDPDEVYGDVIRQVPEE
jgi:glucose-6-phosphate dehydrogenase assembly protein OpcA